MHRHLNASHITRWGKAHSAYITIISSWSTCTDTYHNHCHPMPTPPLTGHENWGGRWEKQAILTCRDGGHRQTQVHCAHVSTVRLESLLHALLAPLTNWSHQYTSGVGPNNTCVVASLSTGEAGFVDAKVHSRPRLSVSCLVVNQ